MQRGTPIGGRPGAFRVARFVEKPDRKTAEKYWPAASYFWNSGMFLFSAATLLQEMAQLQPEIFDRAATQSRMASAMRIFSGSTKPSFSARLRTHSTTR